MSKKMSLADKMAARREKKRLARAQAAQPDWAVERVYKSVPVLDALRDAGDDENAVRPLEHHAIFESQSDAYKFVTGLNTAGGYENIEAKPMEGGSAIGVDFHELSTTQSKDIFDKSVIAEGRVRETGGTYDGWQTQIVAKSE